LVAFPLKFLTRRLAALPVTLILSLVLYSTGPDNSESGLSLLPSSAVSAAESAPFSESFGSGPGEQHTDLVSVVLSSLVIVLMSAKLGGATLELFGQPPVLGELVFGVILGNLSILGFHDLDYLSSNEAISILAEIGVIFLLFEVGLESNIRNMLEVGASSFMVALAGVVTPPLLKISLARGDRLKESRNS
jgi:Sodium/hydrogen exchanger family